jgi:hypothetical protein
MLPNVLHLPLDRVRWWGNVRVSGECVHWDVLAEHDWVSEPWPDATALLPAIAQTASRSRRSGLKRIAALISKWGPPTAARELNGTSLLPFIEGTRQFISEIEWFRFALRLQVAEHAALTYSIGANVGEGALNAMIPMHLARSAGIDPSDWRKLAKTLPLLFVSSAMESAGFSARIGADRESPWHPQMFMAFDKQAPLAAMVALALHDIAQATRDTRPCPNYATCSGVVRAVARVGRPSKFCEKCSPRGKTSSTERVRAYRERKKGRHLFHIE